MKIFDSDGSFSDDLDLNRNIYVKDEMLGDDDLIIINCEQDLLEVIEDKMGRPMKVFMSDIFNQVSWIDDYIGEEKAKLDEVESSWDELNGLISKMNSLTVEVQDRDVKDEMNKSLTRMDEILDSWY